MRLIVFNKIMSLMIVVSMCVVCDWQAKGLLKTGDVVRRLRDAYNRLETSSDTPASHSDSVPSCSQMICDILTLLRS